MIIIFNLTYTIIRLKKYVYQKIKTPVQSKLNQLSRIIVTPILLFVVRSKEIYFKVNKATLIKLDKNNNIISYHNIYTVKSNAYVYV